METKSYFSRICDWWTSLILKISGGKGSYYELTREVFHFAGGVIVGTVTYLLARIGAEQWVWVGGAAVLIGFVVWMEWDDARWGQSRLKMLSDCMAWGGGFLLMFAFLG